MAEALVSGLTLVIGGSRSGKSRWAEHLAASSGSAVLYLATAAARPDDATWCARIAQHRARRPAAWGCREPGADLLACLLDLQATAPAPARPVLLIDSLGTWLAQHLDRPDREWQQLAGALSLALTAQAGPVILVCEEVGQGVVPATAIGGLFRDRMGALQQTLMAGAQAAWWVVAGRALDLHQLSVPVPGA